MYIHHLYTHLCITIFIFCCSKLPFLWKEKLLSASIQRQLLCLLFCKSVTIRFPQICLFISLDLTHVILWSQRLKGFQNPAILFPSSLHSWLLPLLQTAEGFVKVLQFCCLFISTNEPKLSFYIMLLSWAYTSRCLNKLHLTRQLCSLALVPWQQTQDALQLHTLSETASLMQRLLIVELHKESNQQDCSSRLLASSTAQLLQ